MFDFFVGDVVRMSRFLFLEVVWCRRMERERGRRKFIEMISAIGDNFTKYSSSSIDSPSRDILANAVRFILTEIYVASFP